ncbi:MAG TPA: chemoreceptor glutamine deamidase CheD [Rhodopila sp.]
MTTIALRRERRISTPADPSEFSSGSYRYRDSRFNTIAVKVFPGERYVTTANEMIVTVLGSCVSACIRDPVAGIGGMNHFMLPDSGDSFWDQTSPSMRYGNVAMEWLINDILTRGGLRQRLEVKVFGGANVMRGTSDIGHRNAVFVEHYLAAEGIPIAAAHLRGSLPRRIHYFPVSGSVMLLELRRAGDLSIVELESRYQTKLQTNAVAGSAELF